MRNVLVAPASYASTLAWMVPAMVDEITDSKELQRAYGADPTESRKAYVLIVEDGDTLGTLVQKLMLAGFVPADAPNLASSSLTSRTQAA